jgi:hypothetical protein
MTPPVQPTNPGSKRAPCPKTLDLAAKIAPLAEQLGTFTLAELYGAIGWPPPSTRADATRLGMALRAIGYRAVRPASGGRTRRFMKETPRR